MSNMPGRNFGNHWHLLMAYTKTTTTREKVYQINNQYDKTPTNNPAVYQNTFPDMPAQGASSLVTCGTSRAGASLSGYRLLIRSGGNATTAYDASETTFNVSTGSKATRGTSVANNGTWSYQQKDKCWWTGGINVPSPPSAALGTSALNQARTAFYKRYQGQLTLISGGVVLGELKETLQLIKNPAKALRGRVDSYLAKAMKLQRRKRPSTSKDIADTYLEHAFGWAPLLSDLDDAFEYAKKREKQLAKKFFVITGSGKASSTSEVFNSRGFNWITLQCNVRTTYTARAMYKGAISATVTPAGSLGMKSIGLSASDFVPTLWELLPWSFVIDYFTNIGDVIQSYSNGRANLAWGFEATHSHSRAQIVDFRQSANALKTTWYEKLQPASGESTYKRYIRNKITYVPLPEVSFEIPGMGVKWLNLAALVAARKASSKR